VLTESVNPTRTDVCGSGVNVATLDWIKREWDDPFASPIWKCRIRWIDLADAVVPYNTDGKFRAARVELIETVEDA